MPYICPGSTQDFKYTLKTPDLRRAFNYTLYLQLGYIDENTETGEVSHRSTYYPFNLEIAPALLEILRSSANWTLKNPGRDISVKVTMNNTGTERAYNVEWGADLPPYVQVRQGTTSFIGSILEGKTKTFNYVMVSDDPIICNGISSVIFQDRYGNNYTSVSENETFRFSPFITVEKSINKYSWYYDPTKSQFQGATTFEVDEDRWWDTGAYSVTTTRKTEVSLNRTRNLSVSVKIKNMGNAVARGLLVEDAVEGGKLTGTTSWSGELKPDDEVSYEYIVDSLNQRNVSLTTNVKYLDVDPASFKPSIEGVEGRPKSRYCTVTSKSIVFENNEKFFVPVPGLNLSQDTLKVLGGSEFDFNIFILNNGSDSVHDVLTLIDTQDLSSRIKYGGEILKGQTLYYLKELKAKYYPGGDERSWSPINVTYTLVLRAPDVATQESFTITTLVNYTDFYGEVHSKNISTNITVLKALPAYEVATLEKKNLTVISGSPGEIDIDGYGDSFIKLKNTGYADLENVTIKIKVPLGLELYSNDTKWEGAIEAQLRRNDSIWYGFTGDVAWNGSLTSGEETTLPFLVRGKKAGLYEINTTLTFNAHKLSGIIPVKVKGAILGVSKSVSDPLISVDGSTEVTVTIKNVGEASAKFVKIVDHVPPNFDVIGDTETSFEELKPDETTYLRYTLVSQEEGSYTLKKAEVEWTDELGNEYQIKSGAAALEVVEVAPTPTKEPPVEAPLKLTRKQIFATALFALVFFLIMFKFLTLSRPIKEE
jgi:uncharacterized membrane protein